MKLTLRIAGVLLLIMGTANLAALYFIDTDLLQSPVTVGIRYFLMVAAGLGFVLLRRWGPVIYFSSVLINWITYFTIYGGEGSVTPLWLSLPIPLVILLISYFGWNTLMWSGSDHTDQVSEKKDNSARKPPDSRLANRIDQP